MSAGFPVVTPHMPCVTDVGKPGAFHGCRNAATVWFRTTRTHQQLGFCAEHQGRATNPAYVGEPVERLLHAWGPVCQEDSLTVDRDGVTVWVWPEGER